MRLDTYQLYYLAVLGGLGGLIGWILTSLLVMFVAVPNSDAWVYVTDGIRGLVIGLCVGSAICSFDGLLLSRSLHVTLQGIKYGAALGAFGGIVGLILGEILFQFLGGGVWARAIGWAVFGIFVGTSDGVAHKMPSKIKYGAFGGLIGGLIGGSTYERLTLFLLGTLGDRAYALAWGSAVGLIILGACIGAMVGLVESVLRRAWLVILNGRLEGKQRTLESRKSVTTIGRTDKCDIILVGDPQVADVHAEIAVENDDFVLRPRDGKVTAESGAQVFPVSCHRLCSGDRFQIGATRLLFQAVEVKER